MERTHVDDDKRAIRGQDRQRAGEEHAETALAAEKPQESRQPAYQRECTAVLRDARGAPAEAAAH